MSEQRKITMADVASAAGVSVATVSRALAGRGDLPTDTRIRIQAMAADIGYRRGTSQRGRPVTADPRIIELVLGTFDDGWTDEVTAGARAGAAAMGFDLVLTQERDDPADDWPGRVTARRSSGVILGLIRPTKSQIALLRGLAIPMVLLEPAADVQGDFISIGTTDWQGAYEVGEHLAACGIRRFVLVAGEPHFRFGRAREDGFRRAIADRVPGAEVSLVRGDWQDGDLGAQFDRAAAGGEPLGVFACNDQMAIGVYRTAERLGLRIPEDVSVVGFDDIQRAALLEPGLTTVRQPVRDMAARAVRALQQVREGSVGAHERIEIPTTLVVRKSTASSRASGG